MSVTASLMAVKDALAELRLPGVDEAIRRAGAADPVHLDMVTGTWHRELEAMVEELAAGGFPLRQLAVARAMKLKLPELPPLWKLEKQIGDHWKNRPGVLKAG